MKIIIHVEPKGSTNTQSYVETILNGLNDVKKSQNFGYCIATSEKSLYNIDVKQLPFFKGYISSKTKLGLLFNYIRGIFSALLYFKKKDEKIVYHYHWPKFSPIDAAFVYWITLNGGTVISTVHNVLPHEPKIYDKFFLGLFYKKCSHLIFHTKETHKKIEQTFKFTPKCYTYIPHYSYSANDYSEYMGEPNKMLFFGTIREYKGLDILANAIAGLEDEKWELTIAGNPDYDISKIEADLKDYTDQGNVKWQIGWIEEEKLSLLFNTNKIVVLPYKSIDNSGLVYLAMSYGCTVIVPSLGVFKELITDKETGLFFNTLDAEDLKEKITWALNNFESVKEIGRNAKSLMDEDYDISTVAKKYLSVYQSIETN